MLKIGIYATFSYFSCTSCIKCGCSTSDESIGILCIPMTYLSIRSSLSSKEIFSSCFHCRIFTFNTSYIISLFINFNVIPFLKKNPFSVHNRCFYLRKYFSIFRLWNYFSRGRKNNLSLLHILKIFSDPQKNSEIFLCKLYERCATKNRLINFFKFRPYAHFPKHYIQ